MFDLNPATIILVIAVAAFTVVAAFWDLWSRRIPNKLTIPMFFAGWVYQLTISILYGWHHLGSAALGFLVGFGLLFVLWFVGGGGGGDVKLMGALSVWLGFRMTLSVLLLSTIFVLLATIIAVVWNVASKGLRMTRSRCLATGGTGDGSLAGPESRESKLKRRVMAYAGPVAAATWVVMLWNVPQVDRALRAGKAAQPTEVSRTLGGS